MEYSPRFFSYFGQQDLRRAGVSESDILKLLNRFYCATSESVERCANLYGFLFEENETEVVAYGILNGELLKVARTVKRHGSDNHSITYQRSARYLNLLPSSDAVLGFVVR
jgi:hypothetical protein